MRNKDWINLLGVCALVMLLILSPFIPGPSNNLVLALSTAGQLTGFGGMILVPNCTVAQNHFMITISICAGSTWHMQIMMQAMITGGIIVATKNAATHVY